LVTNTILLNDFRRQWAEIREDSMAAFDAFGASGWYILGERVKTFEAALAALWGRPEAVGVASGLDAIEIALRAAGLEPGDRVLTTPLSAFATTLAIVRCGGVPVFCDTDAAGLIDLDEVRAALRAMPGIRFFVPVHLYGFPLEPTGMRALIEEFELVCVEDCAQSILATRDGAATGTTGVAAATSFYPTKNLGALGDGGAVLTADVGLALRVRQLRDYGQSAKYRHSELGWNSRLDELHAALLETVFLPRLAAWTERRRQIATRYLAGWPLESVRPLPAPGGDAAPCWHLFPVRTAAGNKASLAQWLRGEGIATGEHYPILIPDQEALRETNFACFGPLDRARRLAEEELSLPIHPYMTDAEVDAVLDALRRWPGA
jgi:dTDP-3-amino-3,4,6-trideoxy-alpha-D-glucose transaminase